jgi:hypothetical protein
MCSTPDIPPPPPPPPIREESTKKIVNKRLEARVKNRRRSGLRSLIRGYNATNTGGSNAGANINV